MELLVSLINKSCNKALTSVAPRVADSIHLRRPVRTIKVKPCTSFKRKWFMVTVWLQYKLNKMVLVLFSIYIHTSLTALGPPLG